MTILESLSQHAMTPSDWASVVKACTSPGKYLDWRAFNIEFCTEAAADNRAAGNAAWDLDMLLGQGRFANAQLGYPLQVYDQINQCAIRAWKVMPGIGEVGGNLTKITQGPTEPFADFVARMMQAAGHIFGSVDTALPLVKQLIFAQCTKECRAAIIPYKGKPLEVWMKLCRELGGPLSNSGLAAAVMTIMQGKHKKQGSASGACYKCGQQGHI